MMSFEEALDVILLNVAHVGTEQVAIIDSVGRVTAEDFIATFDLPSFDNSAMDGYAVRAENCRNKGTLAVTGYIPAGGAKTPVEPGCAVRIMTGAPIPTGCDAVVPLEDTEERDGTVRIMAPVPQGQHIRYAGEDVFSGETIVPAGTLIRPPEISMLASFGKAFVKVHRKLKVEILATGDELTEAGHVLSPGMVFNSNSPALAAAVQEAGGIPVVLGIARDDREELRQKITEGLNADVLITAAGASVGDRDLVREILAELEVNQLFWRVDIKPGKSFAFGLKNDRPVFSLPGNPVSALVTFEELVRPALLKMMGHGRTAQPLITAILQEDLKKKPGRTYFARVKLSFVNGKVLAWSSGDQDTGFLKTMLRAEALAVLPSERSSFKVGDEIQVRVLSK